MRSLLWGVLLVLLAAPAGIAGRDQEPSLEIKASPRTQYLKPSEYSKEVRLEINLKDQNEEWWCSAVGIFWGDGSKSIIEPACPYFEDADAADIRRTRYVQTNNYRYRGEFTIVVVIGKGEDLIAEKETKIRIR